MSKRRPSFTDIDRPYRRGVVLGLSLAELFIILIFLLLMAMIGYTASREEELQEYEEELKQRIGDQWLAEQTAKGLRDQLSTVSEALEEAEKKLGNIIDDDDPTDLINRLVAENEELTEDNKNFQDQLTTDAPDVKIGKQVREKADELGVDPNELIAATENLSDLNEEISRLEKEREGLEEALSGKGQDSPCWYRMAIRGNGEDYEKPLYIFDIRISDDYIFVKDIPAPTDEYQSQKEELAFDDTVLNRRLDYNEFVPAFQALKLAGHSKEVRNDRRCTFYARVWDATSSDNKVGWQRAHEKIVQNIFITFWDNSAWPH
jgi:hypothetical protein